MATFLSSVLGLASARMEVLPVMSHAIVASRKVLGQKTQSALQNEGWRTHKDLMSADSTSSGVRGALAGMPSSRSLAANPMVRRAFILTHSRHMSTIFLPRSQTSNPTMRALLEQRRTVFNGGTSQNMLAHLEEQANRNPNSATSQYAFYQGLTKANMPALVIERYESNAFASNSSCENLYHRALGAISQSEGAAIGSTAAASAASVSNGNMTNQQMQAIGQAIAARTQNANIAINRTQLGGNAGNNADKNKPLHVVVDESFGHMIYKWVKLIFKYGIVLYVVMMGMSLLVETLTTVKKVGGKQVNEARAEHQLTRFSDVHGCDEAKDELQELVEFLKDPQRFTTLGGKLPKGVLLSGPPGTGKTLLARAVAGEAGVPFFFMSGSEFDEIYVGVGAKRVRDLFTAAKAKSPSIVFIDELDAVGGRRSARDAAYAKQTLNQLLTELDGFDQNSGVIIIAATNFPENLDPALTRPGRFDRNITVPLPDVRGRMAILKHHMQKVIAGTDVSIETLAAGTPGFSGADLENIVNQAAVHASRAKAKAVSMFDFEWAKDKTMMGAERKSMIMTQKEKEMTAYHEAGHALVLMFTPGTDPLHKVTILPRGSALGITFHLPEIDKYSKGLDEYQSSIDVCMGGKVAEQIVYGNQKVTSGAASDITSATRYAYAMVTNYGMSDKLGNVDLGGNYSELSSGTKELIESEVRRLIEESRIRVNNLLTERRKELDLLAKALVDYETLDRKEAFKVIKGEKLEGRIVATGSEIKIPVGVDGGQGKLPEIPGSVGSSGPATGGSTPPTPAGGLVA